MEELNLNSATSISEEELNQVMAYHPWDEEKIAKGQKIRNVLSIALAVIIENVPPSADRSSAIRKIRDCRMDCNSAITHDGKF